MAKVASKPEAEVAKDPTVKARVTKAGDGKISNGVHHPTLGDELYEAGEIIELPQSAALELEERGFVEIEEPKAKAS